MEEYKYTASEEIKKMPAPSKITVPLSQHIGAPCTETVKIGDTVDKGQIIGMVETGLGCPVHASVSGKVLNIEDVYTPTGRKVRQIVIENDGEDRLSLDIKQQTKQISEITVSDCIDAVRLAGISGMGGATFPTYAKIASAVGKVQHIIINSAECEPFITANHRLMLESPKKIIDGLKLLMQVFSLDSGMIAVEDNKMDAVDTLQSYIKEDDNITIKVMKTKYPQGDERQIIYALTGKELPAGKLPADVGCVIFNAETCYNIYRAVMEGMPLIERVVTVAGDCISAPKNVLAPLGTPMSVLIEFCGGLKKKPKKIITGGPMMGVAQWNINAPITKGTNAILAFSKDFAKTSELPVSCIHCGKCVTVCPMHLMPLYLAQYAQNEDYEMCESFNMLSCVECGSCAFICPGNVPIVQYVRRTKPKLMEIRRAKSAPPPPKPKAEENEKNNEIKKEDKV